MGSTESVGMARLGRTPWLGVVGVLTLVALSGIGLIAGLWKALVIGWVAFAAMAGAAALGMRSPATTATRSVWADGLASGAMVTSAAVFLVPEAIGYHPKLGGFGIAAGLLAGFAGHTIGHRFAHLDLPMETTTAQLTAHSLADGIIIGTAYTVLPDLGLLLGLGIVSHKGPAGYAAARRLRAQDEPVGVLALPASSVGVAALLVGLVELPSAMAFNGAVFGFAAGIFLHVALDFLPECETGGEVATFDDAHARLDRLRVHAVASTAVGAGAVALAWLLVV
jgi:ZIP family zinc transporter